MVEFFRRLFSADFMPHALCLRDPGVIALHVISDGLIAVSYLAIPAALVLLVWRRTDLPFRWVYMLFGIFILACGTTHLLSILTLWHPVYRLEGLIKAATALASAGTALVLYRLVPVAVALPGPAQFKLEIEERKRAEEEVRRLNQELENSVLQRTAQLESAAAHLAEVGATLDKAHVIISNPDGSIKYWNLGSQRMYGFTEGEALDRKSHELLRAELPIPFEEIKAELVKNGTWVGEIKQQRRDGSVIWVASQWALEFDSSGQPAFLININNDITELKDTSHALRVSERTVRSLFENASQGIIMVDGLGGLVECNKTMETLFGYTSDELRGAPVEMLLPERFRAHHIGHHADYLRQPEIRPMGRGMDLVGRRKDGSEFPVEISLSFGESQRGMQSVAFISDITIRKLADRERENLIVRLESALAERDVLLKEIHHRVKNNLAVIVGLLGMQSNIVGDDRLAAALMESQQRVASMALIHEFLYANEDVSRVDFGDYVQQLTSEVSASYNIGPESVAIEMETERIHLPVHRAIPCGLILNELLSNALKHAFSATRAGKVTVRFVRLESGDLSLSCLDNGVGIPPDLDWKNSPSMGLKIIQILAKQIHGSLSLDRSEGTRFELRFSDRGSDQISTGESAKAARTQ